MGAMLCVLAGMLPGAPVPTPAVPQELLKARLEAAQEGYRLEEAGVRAGLAASRPESVAQWSQRVLDAKRPLCKDKQEEIAAAQEHLDRMKSLEATTRKMLEAGLLTARELAAVRYHRTEAEILLFRLKGP